MAAKLFPKTWPPLVLREFTDIKQAYRAVRDLIRSLEDLRKEILGVGNDHAALIDGGLTKSYDSGNQTITSAGQLILAHLLGVQPKIIHLWLKNLTAADGYSEDDETLIYPGPMGADVAQDVGTSVVADTTNITIRFGSRATVFSLIGKTSGSLGAQINTNWALIVRAYA